MGFVWLDVGDLVVWTRTHRFIFCFTFLSPVWLTTQNHSTLVTERSAVPFLPVNPEYSATRNQVNTHILVYVCNDWFKGTDRGEGKKDKMEISYFLDRQFMCLLGGDRERSVKLAAAVPQLWECNLSALSLYLSSSPCEVESEISSPLTKFIVIWMAHFWCKHSNPSVHTHTYKQLPHGHVCFHVIGQFTVVRGCYLWSKTEEITSLELNFCEWFYTLVGADLLVLLCRCLDANLIVEFMFLCTCCVAVCVESMTVFFHSTW